MVQEWMLELLKGLGRLLLNPVFYYLFFLAAILGVSRVKRERKNFHVRAENAYFELRQLLPLGLAAGLVLSIITIGAGLVIPIELIVFAAGFTLLWSLTAKIRLLSPVYTVGFAFFAMLFFLSKKWELPLITSKTPEWSPDILSPIAVLLALLILAEGILISRNGGKGTSPKLVIGKRGLVVGIHEVKRLWMLPVFLMIPGESLAAPFKWWPLFSIGEQSYALILVPFTIGFFQYIKGMLPAESVKSVGKRVVKLGSVLVVLSLIGYWYPLASIVIVALAIIGREIISFRQRSIEDNLPFYFSMKNQGVMILGVLPDSPAAGMGLEVGELVMKVNGAPVNDEESFYNALMQNRAHCKLEVLDVNGQIRLTQRALFEGDHHELGILFVQDERKWETKRVQ
ncbi:PDZ domain-containing protein [Bacillus benzoevorans]|uniref:PDZ domain-containing protein n=1 Tax=Bacillus benzoevorans TaxID=1456 RepID=UPI0016120E2A|nr:PDZ domain-containing protein [Bacillus benzoevorans]